QLRLIERASLRLDRARAGLVSPRQRLNQQRERLDALVGRMHHLAARTLERRASSRAMALSRLLRCLPECDGRRRHLDRVCLQLDRAAAAGIAQRRLALGALAKTLEALGPRSVLERGYSITRDAQGNIVKNALDLNVGETLHIEL